MGFLTPDASGELEVLRTYALQQLAQMRSTAYGLTDEQIRATPSVSSLTIGGLLRHAGQVALHWSAAAAAAPGDPVIPEEFGEEQTIEECVADATNLADTLDYFDRCVATTDANIRSVTDLAAAVPVPDAPWFPPDLASWEARWVLAHITAEVARHTGHADIIRESIDGKGSYELNERADGFLDDDEKYAPHG